MSVSLWGQWFPVGDSESHPFRTWVCSAPIKQLGDGAKRRCLKTVPQNNGNPLPYWNIRFLSIPLRKDQPRLGKAFIVIDSKLLVLLHNGKTGLQRLRGGLLTSTPRVSSRKTIMGTGPHNLGDPQVCVCNFLLYCCPVRQYAVLNVFINLIFSSP